MHPFNIKFQDSRGILSSIRIHARTLREAHRKFHATFPHLLLLTTA